MLNAMQLQSSTRIRTHGGYSPTKVDKQDYEVRTASTELPAVEDLFRTTDDTDSNDENDVGVEDCEGECDRDNFVHANLDVARNSEPPPIEHDQENAQQEEASGTAHNVTASVPDREQDHYHYGDGNVDGAPMWMSVSKETPYISETMMPRPPDGSAPRGRPVGRRYVAPSSLYTNLEADIMLDRVAPNVVEAYNVGRTSESDWLIGAEVDDGNSCPDRDQDPCLYADENEDDDPVWTSVTSEAPHTAEIHVPFPPGASTGSGPSRVRRFFVPNHTQNSIADQATTAELESETLVAQGAAAWWMRSPDRRLPASARSNKTNSSSC